MKRDIIERLTIDSAAGELNEDVEALFRVYLEEHPEANPDREEMARIYEDTAATIEAKTREAEAGVGVPATKMNRLPYLNWRSFGRWAAALIVAVLIGFTGGRWPIDGKTSRIVLIKQDRPAAQIKTISDLKEQYAGTFWGDKVMALMEDKDGQRYRGGLQGTGFWDKYRRYRKEKSYE